MGSNGSAPRQLSVGRLKGQDAGAIVRAARLAAGLSLVGLGRRCGYSASQLSRYERGCPEDPEEPHLWERRAA
jgi:ribosome-binding protein aMBF1 (putative translation factor)